MARSAIAILIGYGPEVRAFVDSGLAARLAALHPVVLVAWNPRSAGLRGVSPPVVAFPDAREGAWMRRLRGASRRLRARGWERAERWERRAARLAGGAGAWRDLFRKYGVGCVLAGSYASARTLPALQTATNLGASTVVVVNSWKDVFDKPYAPVPPTALGVFGPGDAEKFAAEAPDFAGRVVAVGSLHLSAVAAARGRIGAADFRRALGLDPSRPIVCFCAGAGPSSRAETPWIRALAGACDELPERPQLLIRANPMDPDRQFAHAAVWRPDWEWSAADDWCCPTPGDLRMWAAVLEEAAVFVSAPSTAAYETALVGKRLLTLVGERDWAERWGAPAYAEVRGAGWAEPVAGQGRLREAVARELRSGAEIVRRPGADAVDRVFDLTAEVLSGAVLEAA